MTLLRHAERRLFVMLDARGARRGFIVDGAPCMLTVQGLDDSDETVPLAFGAGLTVETLPVKAASLVGEAAAASGSLSATLALDEFDVWATRADIPLQTIEVRAWFAPVGDDGIPIDRDGDPSSLRPEYEIFRGVLRSPQVDLYAGTLTFTAEAPLQIMDVQFPPRAIDADRFPDAPEGSTTNAVPVIYGTVASVPLYAVSDVTDPSIRLVVAGHPIVSTAVNIMRDGAVVGAAAPVLYDVDELGGEYAYVVIAKVTYDAGSNLYAYVVVGWRGPDGTAIDGLGDALIHLWRTYSRERATDLDMTRCEAARAPLNRYKLAMLANSQQADTGLMRILSGRLGGQFPVAFGLSGGRFGWDCTRLPTPGELPALVVGTLTYGLDAHDRAGPDESDAGAVVTQFEVHYGLDPYAGGSTFVLRGDSSNFGALRGAVSRWGQSPIQRYDCPDISDGGTAWAVLTDFARALSAVRESVTYPGLPGWWHDLPLLSVVEVTDAPAGYSAEPCLITALAPGVDGRVSMTLLRIRGV